MDPTNPIGLFDSGFGGLTVMREVSHLLSQEHLIYLGDTANLPYGNKSPQTVLQFALKNAEFLMEKKIKLLMIPCHTACSHALETLQKKLPIPVIGVIQSGLDLVKTAQRIAILGTTSTIESKIYQTLIQKQNPKAVIFPKACPLFVPLIEEGFYDHPSAELIAQSYLSPMKGKIDAVLLACTHYPLILPALKTVLGPDVHFINPAKHCALQAYKTLFSANLLNKKEGSPSQQFFVTDDPEKFRHYGKFFLGKDIQIVEKK